MTCNNCGYIGEDNAKLCLACGSAFFNAPLQANQASATPAVVGFALGLAGIVFSALVFWFLYLVVFGLGFGIAATTLGATSNAQKSWAKPLSLTCGIVAIVLVGVAFLRIFIQGGGCMDVFIPL